LSVSIDIEQRLIKDLQKDAWLDEAVFGILDGLATGRFLLFWESAYELSVPITIPSNRVE
jgi:hypothetical protein